MIRRLVLVCALVALGVPTAYGVGLGKLELRSALNQRLDAEIELTNIRDLEPEEILPGLASQEDFDRVGIERNYLMTDMRFKVIRKDDGRLAVHLTSTRPIVEPFLNFLVEVLWPNGRILREYTVLLDPPTFSEKGVEPLRPVETGPAAAPRERVATRPAEPPVAAARRERMQQGSLLGREYGMTGPGDTLWAIALEVKPNDSVSVQQMMMAIQRENPEAFINDNINLLKAGYVLRIPDMEDIESESFASAVREVQAHNDAFEAYKSGRQVTQLDASRRQTSSGDTAGQQEEGELRLLASESSRGNQAGGAADSEQVRKLENELAVTKEDLDRARRASAELNSRIADLEEQIETMDGIIKAKDDDLAALRAAVERMQAQQEQRPTTTASTTSQQASGSLLGNPLVLGGIVVLLILAGAGGLFYMRRRQQAAGMEEEEFDGLAVEQVEEELPESGQAEVAAPVEVEEDEDVSPQTEDVLSEAEIYIAYGRFPQAISFLQNAIEAEPDRVDLQLKLLEVYTQTEDATAFNLQLEQLRALGDDDATARALELQKKIPGAAETAEAAMDATVVASEPVTAIDEPSDDDDDDLSFDLDDLDAETEDDDLGLDEDTAEVDLDLDLDETSSAEGEEALSLDDDLDLDLDLEADSTDESADADEEEELDLGDLDLDLDEDAGDDSSEESSEDEISLEGLGDDEEISLDLDEDDVEISLYLDEYVDAISLDDSDLDDSDLDLDLDEASSSTDSDDELSFDDDDAIELNLDDDDEEIDLGLGDDDATAEDDDAIELDLGDDDDIDFDLDEDSGDDNSENDTIELSLDDDEVDAIDLGADSGDDNSENDTIELDLGDDEDMDLNLDEDASTKLDLARAYIDMGDSDGARNVLQEVIKEGNDAEIKEANELLEQIE